MKVVSRARELTRLSQSWRRRRQTIGFVPTMGALHRGHAALIARARKACDRVIVSVFVNPTQFGPGEDFSRYPRTWAADRGLCAEAGVDAVFHPRARELYPEGFQTFIEVAGLSDRLCGASRPGHFRGVATVVYRLLSIARPDSAFFGEKDFQQLVIIRRMAEDLGLPVRIIGCPTVREKDGLALSSRNRYLPPDQHRLAARIYAALRAGAEAARLRGATPAAVESAALARLREIPGAEVEYVSLADAESLGPAAFSRPMRLLTAVRLANTRLIDNIRVPRPPLGESASD